MKAGKVNIDSKMFGGVAIGAIGATVLKKTMVKADLFKIVNSTKPNAKYLDYAQKLIPTIGLGAVLYYFGAKNKNTLLEGAGIGAIGAGLVTTSEILGIGSVQNILTGVDDNMDNEPYYLNEGDYSMNGVDLETDYIMSGIDDDDYMNDNIGAVQSIML